MAKKIFKEGTLGENLLYIAYFLAIVTGLTLIIVQVIKRSKKPPGSDKETGDNPDKYLGNRNGQNNDDAWTYYTIGDPNDNPVLNGTGIQVAETVEKELYAPFWTQDSTVEGALAILKTQGDWALFNKYWNDVVLPKHKDTTPLLSKITTEMGLFGNGTTLINSMRALPEKIKS